MSFSSLLRISSRLAHSCCTTQTRLFAQAAKSGRSLVIFDKDGTLICFHTLWTPWVTKMAHGLEIGTGMDIGADVYRLLGVTESKQVVPGLLAEATMPEIKGQLTRLLAVHGFSPDSCHEIIDAVWNDNEKQLHADSVVVKPIVDNLPGIFSTLRARNYKIAICTADSRKQTEIQLNYLGVMDLIDGGIVCGDDKDSRPKPNPYNAFKLCKQNDVPPWRAYVVGDTLADLRMGKSAFMAGSIAVLSGVGTRDHLAPYSDHIIPSVGEILPILIGDESVIAAET